MKVIHSLLELPELNKPIITLGTYDGVHEGHRVILAKLIDKAKTSGMHSMLITFDPHPRIALGLGSIALLSTLEEKIELLAHTGLDYLLILPFTSVFAEQQAQDFIEEVIINALNASEVVLGYDHKFGKNRTGDVHLLREVLAKTNRTVTEITAQEIDDIIVSSTKIRKALQLGDIENANRLLGYPYSIRGKVITGNQLGKTLGFPTANISLNSAHKLIPMDGVYAVRCIVGGKTINGMMNIGKRPTLNQSLESVIEVHLFDFNADIYNEDITVELNAWIRQEQRFNGKDALITQLKIDETNARLWFSTH
jgi:riboflavin kinase/FMN adenylyltransferase